MIITVYFYSSLRFIACMQKKLNKSWLKTQEYKTCQHFQNSTIKSLYQQIRKASYLQHIVHIYAICWKLIKCLVRISGPSGILPLTHAVLVFCSIHWGKQPVCVDRQGWQSNAWEMISIICLELNVISRGIWFILNQHVSHNVRLDFGF